jgi:hypothetical protein
MKRFSEWGFRSNGFVVPCDSDDGIRSADLASDGFELLVDGPWTCAAGLLNPNFLGFDLNGLSPFSSSCDKYLACGILDISLSSSFNFWSNPLVKIKFKQFSKTKKEWERQCSIIHKKY